MAEGYGYTRGYGYRGGGGHHGSGRGRGGGGWCDDSEGGRSWRGKGGGRGKQGRDNYHDNQDAQDSGYSQRRRKGRYCDKDGNEGSRRQRHSRGGGSERPPPGLSGRDIGMWYAARSKKKTTEKELQSRAFIQIDGNKERHLQGLLNTIRAEEEIAPQPSQSYSNAYEEDDDNKDTSSSHNYSKNVPDDWFDGPEPKINDNSEIIFEITEEGDDTLDNNSLSNKSETEKQQASLSSNIAGSNSDHKELELRPSNTLHTGDSVNRISDFNNLSSDEDDDDDISDETMMQLAAEADLRSQISESRSDEDGCDDNDETENGVINVTEVYKYQEENDFITEFLSHNQANRRSNERLNAAERLNLEPERDEKLDARLQAEYEEKQQDPRYQRMQQFRKKLPSYNMRKELVKLINDNQVVVISGETGCGKTTQVAQFILDDYISRGDGSLCRVVCTQPRRISAIAVAERVADERAEPCGSGSVGFQIRLESKLPRKQGSILFCTTGILLKWLMSDSWLSRTSHVILDEIHERDLQSDFLMIVLRDLVAQRPDLKIVLMSATLNAEMFSKYYGNCPMTNIPGFTYPVKEYLLEDVLELTGYTPSDSACRRRPSCIHGKKKREVMERFLAFERWVNKLPVKKYCAKTRDTLKTIDVDDLDVNIIVNLVQYIVNKKRDGAILIFLPGWDQISKLHTALQRQTMFNSSNFRIIPLHSLMPTINQKQVFDRPPPGVRKIVIATNIAETSITIDDVVYVIDCGKIKMKNFDPENNLATLRPEPVSKANARQRRGRAGRVQAGECYHLYTGWHEKQLADYQLPEMLRTRLEELCLQIKMLKLGRIEPFVSKAMQPPSVEALRLSIQTLRDLCALDEHEDLTPLGYHLAKMPVDPHTGKMLLFAAMFSCLDPILTIAASLSFKDAFIIPLGKEKEADIVRKRLSEKTNSDHLMLAKAYEGWERAKRRGTASQYCWSNFMSPNTLKLLSDMRRQFADLLCDMKFLSNKDPHQTQANVNSGNLKLVKAVVCAGLYPNVAKLRRQGAHNSKRPNILCSKFHNNINFHPKSVNADEHEFDQQWFIFHLQMKSVKVNLYDSTMVSPYPLLFFGGRIDIRKDHGQDCIVVDDWIIFRASRRIAHLVKELRVELDKLLEYKITHPGVTDWDPTSKEGALMRAITDLITTEEHKSKSR